MNHYPHISENPLRRERLVDLAKFRKASVTSEVSSPLVKAEVQQSPEGAANGVKSDAEPLQ